MNPLVGWALAVLAVGLGWRYGGWQGLMLALSVTVFWLLLQFSRALRAMRRAAQAPVGHVPSAVMLNAGLQAGMTMLKVIGLTRSLGARVDGATPATDGANVWRWSDDGGSHVTLTFDRGGKLEHWVLWRPPQDADAGPPALPSPSPSAPPPAPPLAPPPAREPRA